MNLRCIIALIGITLTLIAPGADAAGTFLFPRHDGQGNDILTPLDTDIAGGAGFFTTVGIGFKSDNGMNSHSMYIPFTVADPTTLSVIDNGIVSGQFVTLANASTLNISGTGRVGGNVDVYDTSKVVMTGGFLGFNPGISALFAHDSSNVTISAGVIAGGLVAYDSSTVMLSSGQVGSLEAPGGTVTVNGGTITGGVAASAGGTVNLNAPVNIPTINASNGGQVHMDAGGSAGNVQANVLRSFISLTNVQIGSVSTDNFCEIDISGGNVAGSITASNSSSVNTSAQFIGGGINANGGSVRMTAGATTNVVTSGFGGTSGANFGTFELDNGMISGTVTTTGTSSASFFGGTVSQSVEVQGNSEVVINGAQLLGSEVRAQNNGQVIIFAGGITGNLVAVDSAIINVLGADIDGDVAAVGGQIIVAGGHVGGGASINGAGGNLEVASGSIDQAIHVAGTATAIISGGTVHDIQTIQSAAVNIGGQAVVVGKIQAFDQSTIFINGGFFAGQVFAFGNSVVVVNGKVLTDFPSVIPGSDPETLGAASPLITTLSLPEFFLNDGSTLEFDGHQLLASLLDPMNSSGMYSEYQISGLFADGSQIPDGLLVFVQNGSAAAFNLVEVPVPEPATASLAVIASLGFLARRKTKTRPSR